MTLELLCSNVSISPALLQPHYWNYCMENIIRNGSLYYSMLYEREREYLANKHQVCHLHTFAFSYTSFYLLSNAPIHLLSLPQQETLQSYREFRAMEFSSLANPVRKTCFKTKFHHRQLPTHPFAGVKFVLCFVVLFMIFSNGGNNFIAWTALNGSIFSNSSVFYLFPCDSRGIWSVGSIRKHHDQMGCYVLDSRWLYGEYHISVTVTFPNLETTNILRKKKVPKV